MGDYLACLREGRDLEFGDWNLFDRSSFFLHLAIKSLQPFDCFFQFMVRLF
jgi:hypothetical protein